MKKGIIGYDLFCGAGGMSMGALMAGINIEFAIDIDKYACDTYKKNHPNAHVICKDIKNILPKNLCTNKPLIIFGGPPCQGFSLSNKQTRNLKNEKNFLFKRYVKFIKIIQPDWFVFENVVGIISFNKGSIIDKLIKLFSNLGYSVKTAVLSASDYGVPQNRSRFFLIGNKHKIDFDFPAPYPFKKNTVKDALYDLPALKSGDMIDELPYTTKCLNAYTEIMRKDSNLSRQNYVSANKEHILARYKYIAQGQNWQAIPDELMGSYKNKYNCHSGIYKRIENDKPSIVIANYRKNMLIHPTENRGLSLREAARLQSFPDTFKFSGTLQSMQQQIGNAVPPLLAKAVFEKISTYF